MRNVEIRLQRRCVALDRGGLTIVGLRRASRGLWPFGPIPAGFDLT
jgi:hypothetical protein